MKTSKKLTGIVLGIAMGTAFGAMMSGAEQTIRLDTHYLHERDDATGETLGSGYYQHIGLGDGLAAEYPELAQALAGYSEERVDYITSNFNDIVQERKESEGHDYEASVEEKYIIRRADDKAFSFLASFSTYTGGAHGYYCYTGVNLSPETGEELQLEDIIPDDAALREAVTARLLEKYPDLTMQSPDENSPIDQYGYGDGMLEFNWVLGPQSLTVFFNPYDIAAYAVGVTTADLSFEEYGYLFADDYTQEGSYSYEMLTWPTEIYDLDGDGIGESIAITPQTGDYGSSEGMTIGVDDKTITFDDYSYSRRPMLIHLDDGRNFLYIDCLSDNDYHILEMVELKKDGPVYLGDMSCGFDTRYDKDDDCVYLYLPVQPDTLCLNTRMAVLGTYSGDREYVIGEDGKPQPLTDWYDVHYYRPLTVKKELSGQEVDALTGELTGQDASFAPGETVSVIRTDGVELADLCSTDGKIIRVKEQTDQWPRLIDGVDENEYLDGIVYAG